MPLVPRCKPVDLRIEPLGVSSYPHQPTRLDHRIVPGGYSTSPGLALRGIVGGTDIGLRSLEHGKHLLPIKISPLFVGAGHVSLEHPQPTSVAVKEKG